MTGEFERASTNERRSGLAVTDSEHHVLVWHFDSVGAAVDELTEAADGLRMMPCRLEDTEVWPATRADLCKVVRCHDRSETTNRVKIADRYMLYVATRMP